MIAALYVADRGVYGGLFGADVDVWSVQRDARRYAGPWPVVAHPPCERWGNYWYGGPTAHAKGLRRQLGDDGGCFAAALAAVRKWGGVLEHPAGSRAWAAFGLVRPPRRGGWVRADDYGGLTCHVEQGHYGHRARKPTWLYACGVTEPPELRWGPSEGIKQSHEYRPGHGRLVCAREALSHRERAQTPDAFRDVLLSIARSATARREVA